MTRRLGWAGLLLVAAVWLSACSQRENSPTAPTRTTTSSNASALSDDPALGNPAISWPSEAPTGLSANGTGQYHANGDEPVVFDWRGVVHAIGYELEIQKEENNAYPVSTFEYAARTITVAYAPGLYRVRIRALFANGGRGGWSDWVVFGVGQAVQAVEAPEVCYTNPAFPFTIVPCWWYAD